MTETVRIAYSVLAFAVSMGFTTTLRLRWDQLARGERIIRTGLIIEHLAFVYGSYYALHHGLPLNVVLPVVMISMLIMLIGFADWIFSDLLPERRRRT